MKIIPKTKLGKLFVGVVILVFLAFLASLSWDLYQKYQGEQQVERLANALRQWEESERQKKIDDKIGGKTPQETLEMFISAVEKGDYDLASKYMILENQEKQKKELGALQQKGNLDWFLNVIKKAEPDGDIENGYFSMKSKTDLGPYYFIRFVLYPSGNWKIDKI